MSQISKEKNKLYSITSLNSKIIKIRFLKKVSIGILVFALSIFLLVFGLLHALPYLASGELDGLIYNILFSLIIILSIALFTIIVNLVMKIVCRKIYVRECLDVITNTKIPSDSPKVLFLYTTHDDFMEKRLFQSMKQSYKNIEFWVSNGSSKSYNSEKVQRFCKKNKINYHSIGFESSNKAENINAFLSQKKDIDFDYLFIMDSDVIVNKNFIRDSLKYFYSERIRRLGFVSAALINHGGKTVFTNYGKILEDFTYSWVYFARSYNQKTIPSFSSSSTIISKEMLLSMNGQFPDCPLEDFYTEDFAVRNLFDGLLCPINYSTQNFDVSSKASRSRNMRIYSWLILKFKRNRYVGYDNDKSSWYSQFIILSLYAPPLLLLLLGFLLPILTTLIIVYWGVLINNILFIPFLALFGTTILILIIPNLIVNGIILGKEMRWYYPIISVAQLLAMGRWYIVQWCKTIIFKKKNAFANKWRRENVFSLKNIVNYLKTDFLFLLIIISTIILFNYFMITNSLIMPFSNLDSDLWKVFGFYSFNIFFGFFFLSYLSEIIIGISSFIVSDKKYSSSNKIVYKNTILEHSSVKRKFYESKKGRKDVSL